MDWMDIARAATSSVEPEVSDSLSLLAGDHANSSI